MEAEAYQARERLGLFNVTLQSPFIEWVWAQSERRKHMNEVERLKTELRWAQERIRAAEARAERAERLLGEAQGASTGKTEAP